MRYINGGRPTPREELRTDYLPFWLAYYERGDAWGFWAAIEREHAASSWAGSTSARWPPTRPTSPSSGYRLTPRRLGTRPRDRGLAGARSTRRSSGMGARRVHASTMKVERGVVARDGEGRDALRAAVRSASGRSASRATRQGDVEYAITREEWEAARAARAPGA